MKVIYAFIIFSKFFMEPPATDKIDEVEIEKIDNGYLVKLSWDEGEAEAKEWHNYRAFYSDKAEAFAKAAELMV